MGSFEFTCAVSKLPIRAGEDVRALLLTKNRFDAEERFVCNIEDVWFPRALPIQAKYNDYGSIEMAVESTMKDMWIQGLNTDIVEKGIGSNTYHDVAVQKNMSWDSLLDAIRGGRVDVYADKEFDRMHGRIAEITASTDNALEDSKEKNKNVPTLKKISERLTAKKYTVNLAEYGESDFYVDELHYGHMRIRGTLKMLNKIVSLFPEFPCAIHAGDTTGFGAELSVYSVPTETQKVNDTRFCRRLNGNKAKSVVNIAMIKESVWQSLLKLDFDDYRGTLTIEGLRKAIDTVAEYQPTSRYDSWMEYETRLHSLGRMKSFNEDLTRAYLTLSNSIAGNGIPQHTFLLLEKTKNIPEDYRQCFAEFSYIRQILSISRHLWYPSHSNGPQFGEWKLHRDVIKGFLDIAEAGYQIDKKNAEKYAAEELEIMKEIEAKEAAKKKKAANKKNKKKKGKK